MFYLMPDDMTISREQWFIKYCWFILFENTFKFLV